MNELPPMHRLVCIAVLLVSAALIGVFDPELVGPTALLLGLAIGATGAGEAPRT